MKIEIPENKASPLLRFNSKERKVSPRSARSGVPDKFLKEMDEWIQRSQFYETENKKLKNMLERNKKTHNDQLLKLNKEFDHKTHELSQ